MDAVVKRSAARGVRALPAPEAHRRASRATSPRASASSRSTSPERLPGARNPRGDDPFNIVEDGKPIGLADAGQDWHTDMSYSRTIAFANVLYGIKIPQRGGKPLGDDRVLRACTPPTKACPTR